MLVSTFVKKWNARQVVAQKRGQVFVGGFCEIQKTAVLTDHHCSLTLKLLVRPFEGDGSYGGAGDGTRTRDSLLGRQVAARSPLASYKVAPRAAFAFSHTR